MTAFMQPSYQSSIDGPFTIQLRLPPSCYYTSSQPGPIEYYVRQDQRWIMFSMDFLNSQYAQTLVCNFVDPTGQAHREIMIFLAGVFSAFLVSFLIEVVKSFYTERGKINQTQPSKVPEPPAESQRHPDVEKLINLVDAKFKVPWWLSLSSRKLFREHSLLKRLYE